MTAAATRCRSRPSGSPLCTAPLPLSTGPGAARGALELDLAEHRVVLDEDGRPMRGRAARPARQPPADRGIHDPRQRRGRRGTGGAASGLHVPGARRARTRKSSRRCAISSTRSAFPGWRWPRARSIRPELFNRVLRARRRRRRSARSSTNSSCAARRRPSTARTISAISAWLCRATPISPRRSGAMPTARASRAGRAAARRLARPATASARSPSTSRRPSGAPPRPNAARSTATARLCWAARSARVFAARISGVASFGLFVTLAGNRRRRAGPDIDAARRLLRPRCERASAWSAAAPAGSSRSAMPSTRPWSRRTRSAAGWCSGSPVTPAHTTPPVQSDRRPHGDIGAGAEATPLPKRNSIKR